MFGNKFVTFSFCALFPTVPLLHIYLCHAVSRRSFAPEKGFPQLVLYIFSIWHRGEFSWSQVIKLHFYFQQQASSTNLRLKMRVIGLSKHCSAALVHTVEQLENIVPWNCSWAPILQNVTEKCLHSSHNIQHILYFTTHLQHWKVLDPNWRDQTQMAKGSFLTRNSRSRQTNVASNLS